VKNFTFLNSFFLVFILYIGIGTIELSASVLNSGEPRYTSKTAQWNTPSSLIEWAAHQMREDGGIYRFTSKNPQSFTSLSVGWLVNEINTSPYRFEIAIRSRQDDTPWSDWIHRTGDIGPGDSPSGLFWGHLYTPSDFCEVGVHRHFEITIRPPAGISLSFVRVIIADNSYLPALQAKSSQAVNKSTPVAVLGTPTAPPLISRAEWLGAEYPWSVSTATTTHAIIHHTVHSNIPRTLAQSKQLMRDMRIGHIARGWTDIGYNFVIDREGRIFVGRHNPQLTSDIRGVHAGNANSQSIGIALIGQFHPGASPAVGLPTEISLRNLERLLAWRFQLRNLPPIGTADINTQWGIRNLQRIAGHREVSATACPGDNFQALLPQIRTNVSNLMITISPPTVESRAATSITATSATLNAIINSDGGAAILERRIDWRRQGTTTWTGIAGVAAGTAFSANLTGLSPNTIYEFRALARNSAGWSLQDRILTFTTLPPPVTIPTVETTLATSITTTSATLNATISSDGGAAILERRFDWGIGTPGTWTSWTANVVVSGNTFSFNLTGLSPGTTYGFRAWTRNSAGWDTGTLITFTTPSVTVPTVETRAATSITATSATLNAIINSDGGAAILERRIDWRRQGTTTWTGIAGVAAGTAFSANLTGLSPNTIYEFRALARNSAGWSLQDRILTFTTLPPPVTIPTVETTLATSITTTSATLNATISSDGGAAILERRFDWGIGTPGTWTSWTANVVVSGNTFSFNLTGLSPGTTYGFRAWTRNSAGWDTGTLITFTTPSVTVPTVETRAATSITATSATLNAIINSDGGAAILERRIDWRRQGTTTWTSIAGLAVGNEFSAHLTGLSPNTIYEFRALASNSAIQKKDGGSESFVTPAQFPLGQIGQSPVTTFALFQNYPNPFTQSTTIPFSIPTQSHVRLSIFNSIGMEVDVLVDEQLPAGHHRISWHPQNLPSGIYFYRLHAKPLSSFEAGQVQSGIGMETSFFIETKKLNIVR